MGVGTRWHLPGVLVPVARDPVHGFVRGMILVTACGRRGPIRVREDLGALSVQLWVGGYQEDPLICDACLVEWDRAEENGALLHALVYNPKQQWASGGAPLVPLDVVTCRGCGGRHAWAHKMTPIAVVPRERRA